MAGRYHGRQSTGLGAGTQRGIGKGAGGRESFKQLEAGILKILDSEAKIPFINKLGAYYYNFWRDAKNPRGLWRRTTLEEYRKPEPKWETVLDVDALGKAEKESWVFHGAQFLKPEYRRCLISLSRGGSDASVVREFDVISKSFVEGWIPASPGKKQLQLDRRRYDFCGNRFWRRVP